MQARATLPFRVTGHQYDGPDNGRPHVFGGTVTFASPLAIAYAPTLIADPIAAYLEGNQLADEANTRPIVVSTARANSVVLYPGFGVVI